MTTGPSHLWHPYTRHSALEGGGVPVFTRAEGLHLYDDQGRSYLDTVSSWWCVALGHGRPEVTQAIQKQAEEMAHCILGNQAHPPALALAERLAHMMPTPDRKVFFASDGSSAVETALKIAVQYFHYQGQPDRNGFISLTSPYHGDTLGAVSLGFMEAFHAPFRSLVFPVHQIDPPPVPTGCTVQDAPVSDGAFEALDALLDREGSRLAGMIVEPLCQGAAGMRLHPVSWLRGVAERCKAHGILLIVDEIAMGFGRTGSRFAFEQAGIDPDLVTVGKALTNGATPLSATIVRERLYDAFRDTPGEDRALFHGHTFTGHPIGCAAALATLDVMDHEAVYETARTHGAALQSMLQETLGNHPSVSAVWGLGLIAAFRLKGGTPVAVRLRDRLLEEGLLLRPLGDMAYLMPPLVTPIDVLHDTLSRIAASLDSL